jgi:hypothetical protein
MKILSIDCGIKTLAVCLIEINKLSKKDINHIFKTINNIQKGCDAILDKLTEEQMLEAQMILMQLKDIKSEVLQKTFEILHWEKINLFPIPEKLKNLSCSKCKFSAKFYKKIKDEYIGFCNKHSSLEKTGLKPIKEKMVKDIPIKTLCETAVTELDKRKQFLDADVVLIEQQPSKNSRMKNFQNMLYSYFIIRGCVDNSSIASIYLVSPKHKLKSYSNKIIRDKINQLFANSKQKSNYDKNKEVSVLLTQELLKRDTKWLNILKESGSKLDDLCDAFLQAYSYSDLL